MTIDEFIEKWNVAYEDKEQEAEFASEMRDDIISILSLINTKNKTGLDDSLDDKSIEQPENQESLSNKKDGLYTEKDMIEFAEWCSLKGWWFYEEKCKWFNDRFLGMGVKTTTQLRELWEKERRAK